MGEFDAAGEIVTGGLIARAIEPGTDAGGAHGDVCLNCGTALIGPHCHRCGQEAHVHRTIGAVWHEILHGVVHFEGKLWRTLPLLAWRPGELTRRYIEGERRRFVSPMALFLFSVFTMFAVFQITGTTTPPDFKTDAQVLSGFQNAAENMRETRRSVAERREELSADDPERAQAAQRLAELDHSIAELDRMTTIVEGTSVRDEVHTGWKRLDKGIEKAAKNPSLMLYKLQANSYKFSWLLIPLSLPFVWLMFAWKRQYHGYDHAVFVTYSIAFMSLLFIAITIGMHAGAPGWLLTLVALGIPPLHIYRQLKGAYRLGRVSALLRTALLLVIILIVGILFQLILLLLGLLG
ncbi:DUF3667 domain-containing protein [Sphingosinithalassobacter sp. CS137]|uniref:DUF3667 domain-containing protein n=1 Tax=Sphingosinithalassobacter sp. CS137 TaxID=2762748 RepID=UPI00165D5AE6|nr:DUF3667 domain-containing protein [Sphingosinithalassobacter sp. CS137]